MGGTSSLGAGQVVAVASVLPYDVVAVVVSVGSRQIDMCLQKMLGAGRGRS